MQTATNRGNLMKSFLALGLAILVIVASGVCTNNGLRAQSPDNQEVLIHACSFLGAVKGAVYIQPNAVNFVYPGPNNTSLINAGDGTPIPCQEPVANVVAKINGHVKE